jgi:hypothetical protein
MDMIIDHGIIAFRAPGNRISYSPAAPAFSQDNAWPNNSAPRSQQVTKPQIPEQPPRQLQYPSLQPEPPKPQTPQFQEPSLRAQFSGAPDLSFLRGEEAPKPQMPQEQFQPPQALHPHLMGEPHRPAEQPRNADQPPYFPHPAFARGIPQQWPPQERFPQRQEVPDLPPWLMGAHERAQKESQRPEVSLPPPPQPPLSAVMFAQMGGTSEQYIGAAQTRSGMEWRWTALDTFLLGASGASVTPVLWPPSSTLLKLPALSSKFFVTLFRNLWTVCALLY